MGEIPSGDFGVVRLNLLIVSQMCPNNAQFQPSDVYLVPEKVTRSSQIRVYGLQLVTSPKKCREQLTDRDSWNTPAPNPLGPMPPLPTETCLTTHL